MKRSFTYQFLKDLMARSEEIRKKNQPIFAKLETIAIVDSVEGSNAIGGIIATKDRIKAIVENAAAPLDHNEEEIAGYHDATKFLKDHYRDLDFNEGTVRELHRLLTARHIGFRGGEYKRGRCPSSPSSFLESRSGWGSSIWNH